MPLTVLAGANSSGKSSLIQALLFCVQSFGESSTVINGDLVRLGKPMDVLRAGAAELTIEFAQTISETVSSNRLRTVEHAMRLSLAPGDDLLIPRELRVWTDQEQLLEALDTEIPEEIESADGEALLTVQDPERLGLPPGCLIGVRSLLPRRLVYRVQDDALRESFHDLLNGAESGRLASINELWAMISSREVEDLEPDQSELPLYRKIQQGRLQRGKNLRLSPGDREALFALYRDSEAPNGWASEPVGRRAVRRPDLSPGWATGNVPELTPLLRAVTTLSQRAENLAHSLLYLGPLREDPRVAYPLGHSTASLPVGEKGQFTAAFLERNRQLKPRYVDPDGTLRVHDVLASAVSRWCRYLEIGQAVSVKSEGKMGYQLNLTLNGKSRDMTAIGVGASQLLPVVVLVLGAPQGATVLFEQPELHLHPAVQSRLGNFFALARPDLRLLVETHSEYLITRLRRLVAARLFDPGNINVLFAEQEEGITRFDSLGIDASGDFDHWPAGFFDTLDSEYVALAEAVAHEPGSAPEAE
jgi:putative AbiEii toxin of type IV toxin-antitoxin system